eukprot:2224661-Prymnesium_polylepis.1
MAEVDTKRARLSLDGMVPTSEAYPVSVGAECASCDEEVERLFELKCVVQPVPHRASIRAERRRR